MHNREHLQRLRGAAPGYSLIELAVAMGVFTVLLASGLPHLDTRRQDVHSAAARLAGDYRWARMRAITSGEHFAVEWTGAREYAVQRLRLVGTDWQVAEVVKTVALPDHLSATAPGPIEFNTRGAMIAAIARVTQTLTDDQFGASHTISIWPSGQIHEDS